MSSAGPAEDREILSTCVLDAPRERVFAAWTEPDQLARWWGPQGFTSTFHEYDLRPGGNWRFVMHGPDGEDRKHHSVFLEIAAPERIVFRHVSGPQFQATATFARLKGGTLLTFRMLFDTAEECAGVRARAVSASEETFGRLAALLAR